MLVRVIIAEMEKKILITFYDKRDCPSFFQYVLTNYLVSL